jgi:pyruvate,orthophosphate dikinase
MLLEEGRLDVMREMILAEDDGTRRSALDRLESVLRSDLREVFGAMDGLPVTVRLLDPPLHEFLPREGPDLARLARISGRSREEVLASVERHRESNPMLGRRGVRLGIAFPEISRMQARAIFDGALDATAEGTRVRLEIMIPLVMSEQEVARQRGVVETVAESVFSARGTRLPYAVGTMVELPRAALVAAALAKRADFFSFGTNDLTQTTLGLSRDDAGGFLPLYVEEGYLVADPFRTLDLEGVGRLVRMAVHQGRRARKGLEMGVCGEHAGDPRSIDFFHGVGVDYLSCSPYRVPVARLAAAQAALQRGAEASAGRMPDEEALREPAARRTSSTAEEGVGAW